MTRVVDYCNCPNPEVKWNKKYPYCTNCNKWVLLELSISTDTIYISQLNRRIRYGSISEFPQIELVLDD